MGKKQGSTSKVSVDISEFTKAMDEAKRKARLADSEFKKISETCDRWSENSDVLTAKINSLNSNLDAQKIKLKSLEAEYKEVVEKHGETSAAAMKCKTAINEQQAAINKTERNLKHYEEKLEDVTKAEKIAAETGKDVSEVLEDMKNSAEDASEGFTVIKGAISALIAEGFKQLAQMAKESFEEMVFEADKAVDSFQAKTGLATEAIGEYKDVIDELYRSNYGESFEDIANSMAEIKQQTNEIDPTKLKDLTQNALALRDTFGFEVQESIRAANMLMDQFGISGTEAFNLIVQGAQQGLDKNGDLLDTINEYGVHYKQLGYDSEDFFNSLVNGAAQGTFSVDKLGDAVKEFGIRTKDTAKSTTEGFELINLNADAMRKEFAKGGDSAQKATQKTLKALFELNDEVKQNQAGVALFGTMWEDLGIEGVKALMNTEGELSKTKQSMEEINQIKYDNVYNSFEQVGRTIKMDLLMPLAEDLLPTIEKVTDTAIKHSDEVVAGLKAVGAVAATVFTVNQAAKTIQSISTITGAVSGLKKATEGASAAQKVLNLLHLSIPGAKTAAVIGLIATALVSLAIYASKSTDETEKLIDEIDELNEEAKAQADTYKELKKAKKEAIQSTTSEYSHYSELAKELSNITDENGKVIAGYEIRAKTITGILSDALGDEISLDKLVADGKQAVIDKINETIEAKRAEALMLTYEEEYNNALRSRDAAHTKLTEAKEKEAEVSKKLKEAEAELQAASVNTSSTIAGGAGAYITASTHVSELQDSLKKAKETTALYQEEYLGYTNTITNYDNALGAMLEGNSEAINRAMVLLTNDFVTAENATKESLEQQVKNAEKMLKDMQKALKDGEPGVTQQMVDNAKILVAAADTELSKLENVMQSHTASFEKRLEYAGGLGAKGITLFTEGALSQKGNVKKATEEISAEGKSGLESADTEESGGFFLQGFINGMTSKRDLLFKTVNNTGTTAVDTLRKSIKEGSPAKETIKRGRYFTEGFANGILELIDLVKENANRLGVEAITELSDILEKKAHETIEQLDSLNDIILASEQKYLDESARIEAEKSEAEYQERLKNAKTAEEVEKIKQDRVKKEQEKATKAYLESLKETADKEREIYDAMLDTLEDSISEAIDKVKDFDSLQKDIADNLTSGSPSTYQKLTFHGGDSSETVYRLADVGADNAVLREYSDMLDELDKKRGGLTDEIAGYLSQMGLDEGMHYVEALLNATDAEFNKYLDDLNERATLAEFISEKLTTNQMQNLQEELINQFSTLPEELSLLGVDGATEYGEAFIQTMEGVVESIQDLLSRKLTDLLDANISDLTENLLADVNEKATTLKNSVATAHSYIGPSPAPVYGGNVTNFTQNNYSPTALSRLDIYRNTRNLLGLSGGKF